MANQGQKQNIIYVGGLDMAVTQNVLHQAFEPFGAIAEINMPKPDLPSNPDPHRGFAYMTFEEPSDAKEAIYNMNLAELHGRTLKVSVAKPLKKADEGLGSKTAIWEQVCLAEAFTDAILFKSMGLPVAGGICRAASIGGRGRGFRVWARSDARSGSVRRGWTQGSSRRYIALVGAFPARLRDI